MAAADLMINLHPEPIPVYKFKVYLQLTCLGFSKITNIEESVETEPLQEGGVNDRVYSLTRPVSTEKTLVMERGVANRGFLTAALSSQLEVGNRIHTDILIIAYDRDGTIAKMFEVHGAVVKKLAFSPLDSMSNEGMIETFELAYETLKCLDKTEDGLGNLQGLAGVNTFV